MRPSPRWSDMSTAACVVAFFLSLLPTASISAGELVDPGGVIKDIVASPVGNDMYASLDTGKIVKVPFAGPGVSGQVTAVGVPGQLAVAPDGSRLYVALEDSFDVAVYSLPGMTYVDTFDLSATNVPSGIAAGTTRLYVSWEGGLSVVDTATGTELYYDVPNNDLLFHQTRLYLSPDESTLVAMTWGVLPLSLLVFDVSEDTPVQVGEDCCHGCAGGYGRDVAFSPDGSFLYVAAGSPYYIRVLNRPPNGLLNQKHTILTGPYPNAVEPTADGTRVFVAWQDDAFAIVRISDWLPFRIEPLLGSVVADGLVVSADGLTVAAAIEYASFDPDRIELVPVASVPNRGGIQVRPLDNIEGVPIRNARIDINVGADNYVDIAGGILGRAPLQPADRDVDVTAFGYDDRTFPVTITSGNWTSLGDQTMVRTGDFAGPLDVCTSPAVVAAETSVVQVHGQSFLPGATVESTNSDFTIVDYTWVDWATFDVTVSVAPSAQTGFSGLVVKVINPDGEDDWGHMYVLPPSESAPTFTMAAASFSESAGTVSIVVNRSGAIDGQVSVDYQTDAVTATADVDFTTTSGTLIWLDGESDPQNIEVPILQDTEVEGDQTFTLTLSNVTGGILGGIPQQTVTIIDDDASYLQFSAPTYEVNENGGNAQITVTRAVRMDVAVSVYYTTSNGTAVAPGDYATTFATLNWDVDDITSRLISVPIVNDPDPEGNETVTLTLSSPSTYAVLGEPSSTVLTIVDDDGSMLALGSAAYATNERDGSVTVEVMRTNSTTGTVTVDYATSDGSASSGSDYIQVSGTLSWGDGDGAAKTFEIPILEDGASESDETVDITLSNPTGTSAISSPGASVLTISDNDGSAVQFSASTFEAQEDGGSALITVQRVGGTEGAVSVAYTTGGGTATAGADYGAASGTLNWADGDGGDKTFTIDLIDDALIELTETVALALHSPSGNASLQVPSAATLSIIDDEALENRINTATQGDQTAPKVATSATGASVVVWDSYNQDGSGWGVFGQRLDAAGAKVGGEIQINGTSTGHQLEGAVAIADDGTFLAVWKGYPGLETAIYGRRFDSAGDPLGDDFIIASSASGDYGRPQVAVDGAGRFMVVWQGSDADGTGVFARVYNSAGVPFAGEFAVNTTTAATQELPAVAGRSTGGFVVVWESFGQDGFQDAIVGRRYGGTGTQLAGEFVINNATAGSQLYPDVATVAGDAIVVVWEGTAGQDGSGSSVQCRWFDGAGNPAGDEFTVNSYTTGNQGRPAVGAEPAGRAVVTWESLGQDGSEVGIFGRDLLDDGGFASDEFPLNTYAAGSQYLPSVECSSAGIFTSVWASEHQDGSGDGVYGVTWPLPLSLSEIIFVDGFESGDTTAWSASIP